MLEQARQQAREIVATANRTAEQVRTDAQARGQSEYDRIVGNADAEIALARQRAVEEAAARMGEIVMEVVERIIGREVERRGAPRPDRRGRRRPAGRHQPAAPPRPGPGRASEPDAPGVHGRGRRGGRPGRARPASRPTWRRSSSSCSANPQLRAALTDTAVPGPARRAVMLDLLEGKVSPDGAPAGGFAAWRVPAPEVAAAAGLAGHPGARTWPRARTTSRRSA